MAVTFVPALAGLELYRPGLPIEEVRRTYGLERVVKLASNEFPLPPFPEVRQAVLDAVDGLQRYPDGHSSVLREALAELYDRGPDQVVVGSGSCELVYLLALAVLRPGDQAVLPAPSFSPYRYVTVLCGAEPVKVRLRDHTHDLEAMAQAVTPRTRMLVVCNPNNPTGTHVPPSEIARLVERVPDDVLVVIDEAYVEFVTADDREGSLDIQRAHENVVVLRTFSKIYGLSGLRTGYGLCAPEVREALDKVRQPFNVNLLGQLAATEALKYPHRVAERREANARLRDRLAARLAELTRAGQAGTMLNARVCELYQQGRERLRAAGAELLAEGAASAGPTAGTPTLWQAPLDAAMARPELLTEVFGPSTLLLRYARAEQLLAFADALEGQLTATLQAEAEELPAQAELVEALADRAGRLIVNQFPTGVEVGPAMVHGGPWPATSDGRGTSVGTLAIDRFTRWVAYQNFPRELLPPALRG